MSSDGLRSFPCAGFQGLRWAEEALQSLGRRRGRLLLWGLPQVQATPSLPGWERTLVSSRGPGPVCEAGALPYRGRSFDAVFLMDAFADRSPEERFEILDESLRVARRLVVVVTPLAELKLELGIKLLYEFAVAHLGYDHPGSASLRRRVNGTLPDETALCDWLGERALPFEVFRFGNLFSSLTLEVLSQYLEGLDNGSKLVGLFRELNNLRFHTEGAQGAALMGLVAICPEGRRALGRIRERFRREAPSRPTLSSDELSLVHLLFHLQGLKGDRRLVEVEARLEETKRALDEARGEADRLRQELEKREANPLLRAYARMAEKKEGGR